MFAYKLMSLHGGKLYPLFIDKDTPVPVGEWMEAEEHPTKGFKVRPGWHCTHRMSAPHLKKELKRGRQRVWCHVEIGDYDMLPRPDKQGGMWYLAKWMKVHEVIG